MKAVILAGGLGTRISEETSTRPKPMVEIGGRPILWHIMKTYSAHGINDFVICCCYKGYVIKEYFANYYLHASNFVIDLKKNRKKALSSPLESWKITLIDTGANTGTGGRLKKIEKYIGNSPFMMTYGDGLGNINISELVKFHKRSKRIATITAAQPAGRFGAIKIGENNFVQSFAEKPKGDGAWVNAGFFVLEPEIFKYIESFETMWEKEPLEKLAKDKELLVYKHSGFWHPMDTLRDKIHLESLWVSEKAPWKIW